MKNFSDWKFFAENFGGTSAIGIRTPHVLGVMGSQFLEADDDDDSDDEGEEFEDSMPDESDDDDSDDSSDDEDDAPAPAKKPAPKADSKAPAPKKKAPAPVASDDEDDFGGDDSVEFADAMPDEDGEEEETGLSVIGGGEEEVEDDDAESDDTGAWGGFGSDEEAEGEERLAFGGEKPGFGEEEGGDESPFPPEDSDGMNQDSEEPCPECNPTGEHEVGEEHCTLCGGEGFVPGEPDAEGGIEMGAGDDDVLSGVDPVGGPMAATAPVVPGDNQTADSVELISRMADYMSKYMKKEAAELVEFAPALAAAGGAAARTLGPAVANVLRTAGPAMAQSAGATAGANAVNNLMGQQQNMRKNMKKFMKKEDILFPGEVQTDAPRPGQPGYSPTTVIGRSAPDTSDYWSAKDELPMLGESRRYKSFADYRSKRDG